MTVLQFMAHALFHCGKKTETVHPYILKSEVYNSFESRNDVIMTLNYCRYLAFIVVSQCSIIVLCS